MKRVLLSACAGLCLSLGPALSQSSGSDLLEGLKDSDPVEAAKVARELERLWALSGSTSVDMIFRRGREAMEAEDWSLAVEHFTAVTDHAPEFAEAWHARATAYYQLGKFGPALSDLGQALQLNPNHWNALYGFGIVMRDIEDYGRAAEAFQKVLDVYPYHERAQEAMKSIARFGVGQEA
jgi:tetratricopeptide (TPR) repeat protein